jgi:hypothetical protein
MLSLASPHRQLMLQHPYLSVELLRKLQIKRCEICECCEAKVLTFFIWGGRKEEVRHDGKYGKRIIELTAQMC